MLDAIQNRLKYAFLETKCFGMVESKKGQLQNQIQIKIVSILINITDEASESLL